MVEGEGKKGVGDEWEGRDQGESCLFKKGCDGEGEEEGGRACEEGVVEDSGDGEDAKAELSEAERGLDVDRKIFGESCADS